jgi:hypothetical protein
MNTEQIIEPESARKVRVVLKMITLKHANNDNVRHVAHLMYLGATIYAKAILQGEALNESDLELAVLGELR